MMGKVIGFLLIFSAGSFVGQATVTPEVDIVRLPPRTEVVEKKVPGDTVYIMPDSCLRALEAAKNIYNYSSDLYDSGTRQLNILKDARTAIGTGGDLSVVENNQRALHGETVGHLAELSRWYFIYDTAIDKCNEEKP